LKWVWYLNWEDTEKFNRQDYYFAQLTAQIERGQVKNPNSVKIESKLLNFTSRKQAVSNEAHMQNSKNFWLGMVGVKGKKEKRMKKAQPKK
jgi:anti-sigma-K factor RskA